MNMMPERKPETGDDCDANRQHDLQREPILVGAFVGKVENVTKIFCKQPVKVVVFEHDESIDEYMAEDEIDEPDAVTFKHADKPWYMGVFHGTLVPETKNTFDNLIEQGKTLKKEAIKRRIEQLSRQNDEVMEGIREMQEAAGKLDE